MIKATRIKELREELNISAFDLANRVGVSAQMLRTYEKGKPIDSMSIDWLIKIADFFNVSLDYLTFRSDEKPDIKAIVTESYEQYLRTRKIGYNSFTYEYKPEFPYNLLEAVTQADWLDPLTDDQKLGLNFVLSNMLTDRERTCVELYFGQDLTYEKVSGHFNVGRERIRQILAKVLRKIRNPERFKFIKYGFEGAKTLIETRKEELRKSHLKELIRQNEKMEKKLDRFPRLEELVDVKNVRVLSTPINELELSVRSYNCLKRWKHYPDGKDIKDLYDLTFVTEEELMKCRNLGRRSLEEIKNKMAEFGLHLKEVEA